MEKKKKNTFFIVLGLLLLLVLIFYFYTYFFAAENKKVIYEDPQRRIYLNERKVYGTKGREMWRMVYEDMKSGQRYFVLGNSKKGLKEKEMAKVIINTVDQGKTKSFDQVNSIGVTMKSAKTDIHSNLIAKKGASDIGEDLEDMLPDDLKMSA